MIRIEKTRLIIWTIIVITLLILNITLTHAQLPATVQEPSFAMTYNQIAGSRGWGILGAVPFQTRHVNGNASAIAQSGGNIIRGKYHAEAGITLRRFDFKLYTDGTFKGYSARDIGRQADIGLAVEFPEFSGRRIPRDRRSRCIRTKRRTVRSTQRSWRSWKTSDTIPNTLDGRELESLHPPPSGLSFKAGNSLNLLTYILLTHPKGFNVAVKAMPELVGAGDNPVHQLIITPSTSLELRHNINIEFGADIGIQTFNDTIERELATLIAIKLTF